MLDAYKSALAGDPVSAFGGIFVTNKVVDKKQPKRLRKFFFEVFIAPGYDAEALEIFKAKKNLIILVRKAIELSDKPVS